MASLYSIVENYREALEYLDDLDCPEDAIENTLAGLEGLVTDKALAVGAYIANLESEAAQVAEAEGKMKARKQGLVNKAKRLRSYLITCMKQAEIESVNNAEILVKINKPRQKVVVDNLDEVPDQLIIYERKPDKAEIKRILTKGDQVEGAHLEYGDPTLSIR